MTRNNYLRRRERLIEQIIDARIDYVYTMDVADPQSRRATTLAAKRLMRASRALWLLGTTPPK